MHDGLLRGIDRRLTLLSLPAIALLVMTAFGGALQNGFVWDDETFIVNNPAVHDVSRWPLYFTDAHAISSAPLMHNMYRPLQTLSFALDWQLWGSWAGGHHLTSLLLHIATSWAVVFAFGPLVGIRPAVLAAVFFSLHPALSEAVLSLAARGNQLSTFFALLAIGAFVRAKRPFDRKHLFSVAATGLAVFSKEQAVALLVLLPLTQATFERPAGFSSRRSFLFIVPNVAAIACYLAARAAVIETTWTIPYWGGGLGMTLLMQAKVFLLYLRLLVWPFALSGRYPVPAPDMFLLLYLLCNLLLIAAAGAALRRGPAGRLFSFAVAWFYLSLLPVSNVIPLPGSMMGERFLYLPFAGCFAALAAIAGRTRLAPSVAPVLIAVLLVVLGVADRIRTGVWKNNATFFSPLAEEQPDAPVIQVQMAREEVLRGDPASAAERLEHALRVITAYTPQQQAPARYWYGRALLALDRPREALDQFRKVAAASGNVSPDLAPFYAEAATRAGDLDSARAVLEEELARKPQDDRLWNSLGNVLVMAGDRRGARNAYIRARTLNPANREAAANLDSIRDER